MVQLEFKTLDKLLYKTMWMLYYDRIPRGMSTKLSRVVNQQVRDAVSIEVDILIRREMTPGEDMVRVDPD